MTLANFMLYIIVDATQVHDSTTVVLNVLSRLARVTPRQISKSRLCICASSADFWKELRRTISAAFAPQTFRPHIFHRRRIKKSFADGDFYFRGNSYFEKIFLCISTVEKHFLPPTAVTWRAAGPTRAEPSEGRIPLPALVCAA